jgi:hypothetical protein
MSDYWMGRDSQHRGELTNIIQYEAMILVNRVNTLLDIMDGVTLDTLVNGSLVTSGWRPASVNLRTPNAAVKSKHMVGQAIDLYDPDGEIDDWCMAHLDKLEAIGLWLEHPSATKGWCHLQSVPPKSGKRVYYP